MLDFDSEFWNGNITTINDIPVWRPSMSDQFPRLDVRWSLLSEDDRKDVIYEYRRNRQHGIGRFDAKYFANYTVDTLV